MRKIKVLLVDDSAVVRQVVLALLEREPDIQVIGTASDPLFAMDKMARQWPDVILLDVEMPRMDGITFLRKIMAERPTPVVICSSLTEKGAETTLQALAAGAVEIISKPKIGLKSFLQDSAAELLAAIRAAAQANLNQLLKHAASAPPSTRQTACRCHSARRQRAGDGTNHRARRRHRHLHRRHAGTGSRVDGLATGMPGYRDRATHAGKVHRLFRGATEQSGADRDS